MEKKIKIAVIYVTGIRKRCRKSERMRVQGTGATKEQALSVLYDNVCVKIADFRSYEFDEKAIVFNGTALPAEPCRKPIITVPIYPTVERDELETVDFKDLVRA